MICGWRTRVGWRTRPSLDGFEEMIIAEWIAGGSVASRLLEMTVGWPLGGPLFAPACFPAGG